MPLLQTILHYIFHLGELRSILKWLVWYNPPYKRNPEEESPELKECYRLLNLTSKSFSRLIQELPPQVRVSICLFYLILRGLDTIEDDMTIDIEGKEPLLRNFHTVIEDESWTYDGNAPTEKDRGVLVKFDVVTKEFKKIKEEYRIIIKDITRQMGKGMADQAWDAQNNNEGFQTVQDYEMYCHNISGLVGEGIVRLVADAKLLDPELLERPELIEAMGQFMQQVVIIRDIQEDHEEQRYFWPKEVWSKYVDRFPDIFLPENKEKALECQSEMISIALQHAERSLALLAYVHEPVMKFFAVTLIPLIATLEICFQNYTMFEQNIRISRGTACDLMMRSYGDFQLVCELFREYARKIHRKNRPQDPHFLAIRSACDRIESYIESALQPQKAHINKVAINRFINDVAQDAIFVPTQPLSKTRNQRIR